MCTVLLHIFLIIDVYCLQTKIPPAICSLCCLFLSLSSNPTEMTRPLISLLFLCNLLFGLNWHKFQLYFANENWHIV